jgi:hypothetical protein
VSFSSQRLNIRAKGAFISRIKKKVSLGIVIVVQLSVKVVYLHINREREFWCSPGIMVFPIT